MSKTQSGWIWLGAGLAAAYFGWVNRRLLTVNDITTGESAAYPTLRSRVYYTETHRAMTVAEQVLKRLPGWQVLSRDSDNEILEATAASQFGLLTDDVTVYFFGIGHGQTRVTIRARTRTGLGDLAAMLPTFGFSSPRWMAGLTWMPPFKLPRASAVTGRPRTGRAGRRF